MFETWYYATSGRSQLIRYGNLIINDGRYLLSLKKAKGSLQKKTAIIVTLSLPGGRGVSQNPYNKSNYYRDIDLWRGGVQTQNSLL